MAEIRRANKEIGHHYFNSKLRIFKLKLVSGVLKGFYFILIEPAYLSHYETPTVYKLSYCKNGYIKTISEDFKTKQQAKDYLKMLSL